jgi:hypothetical protein
MMSCKTKLKKNSIRLETALPLHKVAEDMYDVDTSRKMFVELVLVYYRTSDDVIMYSWLVIMKSKDDGR